ncbi:alpha/beta hydrolase fold protein [Penicillium pulvis]|uniref:alpha/beta hydrolase fold protein n=1 Tax=Penicillium pulvis TaxID=1562058 RepID=UPI002546A740|nr:alpha/beta hydrolase fold protein [Penicillium pulvis]KAJ5806283.1 alpha/beta hydrolase fold protein [Penicillium pulvis]
MSKTHEVNPIPQLSILDRLQIARTFLFRVPWTIVSTLSRRWWPFSNYKPPPLRKHLFGHLMTCIFNNVPLAVIQQLVVRDGSQLLDSIRYKDLNRHIFQCIQQENFTGYWICRGLSPEPINPVDADILLLYVHGGGYAMGHPAENAPELLFMAELLAGKGLETAIFSLNYSLMPNGYFPTQINQLFAAYEWIVHTLGVDPSKILIMGESAGAHLVLSFLTFLSEMSESASLSKPGFAYLLSPWANLRSDHPETLALHWEDRLFKQSLDVSARDFLRNATSDQLDLYENFATNSNNTKRRTWDKILPEITRVSAGSDELVFLYDILDFVRNAQKDGAECHEYKCGSIRNAAALIPASELEV